MLVAQLIRDRHALDCRGHRLWAELDLRARVDRSGDRTRQEVLRGNGAYYGYDVVKQLGLAHRHALLVHVVRVDDAHVKMI